MMGIGLRYLGVGLTPLLLAGCCIASADHQTFHQSKKAPLPDLRSKERVAELRKRDAVVLPVPGPQKKQVVGLKHKKPPLKKNQKLVKLDRAPVKDKKTKPPVIKGGLLPDLSPKKSEKVSSSLKGVFTLLRTVEGVELPQSLLFDQKRLRFYVSRLGAKQSKDGAIALLSRDGSVINQSWISGLDQPRGMALKGNLLYVADGRSLVEIDIEAGRVVKRYSEKDVFYFNDLVMSDDGSLFASSPLSNSIYKFDKKDGLQLWVKDETLSGPNSLTFFDKALYVASIGLLKDNEGRAAGGGVFRVDLKTQKINTLKNVNLPSFTSLASDGEGHLYATVEGETRILKFSLTGELQEDENVRQLFGLKESSGLGDFQYLRRSKEFWVPVKSNGHILVFGRRDAQLSEERQ